MLPVSTSGTTLVYLDFLITGIVMTFLGPMLPLLSARWSLTDEQAGYLIFAQFFSSMFGMLSSAALVQRVGYRLTFIIGLMTMASGVALLVSGPWLLGMIAVCILGVGHGITTPAGNLRTAEVNPQGSASALSLINAVWGLGAMSSPFLVNIAQRAHRVSLFLYGTAVALVVLLIAFGSVVAMGLPILTAIAGVMASMAALGLWAAAVPTPDFTTQVAMMIGIGVGIDYALFIVTRHRQHLHEGMSVEDAAGTAVATAGQAVLFAGTTVVIAILGLFLAGLPAISGMGAAVALVVAVAMIAAITLLPGLLGLAGTKIDKLSIHRKSHVTKPAHETLSGRWAHHVGSHSVRYAIVSLGVLCAIALRRGRIAQSGRILATGSALIVASFLWASSVGGEAVDERFVGAAQARHSHRARGETCGDVGAGQTAHAPGRAGPADRPAGRVIRVSRTAPRPSTRRPRGSHDGDGVVHRAHAGDRETPRKGHRQDRAGLLTR
jgi:fucose permease